MTVGRISSSAFAFCGAGGGSGVFTSGAGGRTGSGCAGRAGSSSDQLVPEPSGAEAVMAAGETGARGGGTAFGGAGTASTTPMFSASATMFPRSRSIWRSSSRALNS